MPSRPPRVGVMVMIIAGPIGVAVAVLILGCRLILETRRPSLRLLSARGASLGQLRRLLGTEGVLIGAVPAVAGAAHRGGRRRPGLRSHGHRRATCCRHFSSGSPLSRSWSCSRRPPRSGVRVRISGAAARASASSPRVSSPASPLLALTLLFVRGYSGASGRAACCDTSPAGACRMPPHTAALPAAAASDLLALTGSRGPRHVPRLGASPARAVDRPHTGARSRRGGFGRSLVRRAAVCPAERCHRGIPRADRR